MLGQDGPSHFLRKDLSWMQNEGSKGMLLPDGVPRGIPGRAKRAKG